MANYSHMGSVTLHQILCALVSHDAVTEHERKKSTRDLLDAVPSYKVLEMLLSWALVYAGFRELTYLGSLIFKLLVADSLSFVDKSLTDEICVHGFRVDWTDRLIETEDTDQIWSASREVHQLAYDSFQKLPKAETLSQPNTAGRLVKQTMSGPPKLSEVEEIRTTSFALGKCTAPVMLTKGDLSDTPKKILKKNKGKVDSGLKILDKVSMNQRSPRRKISRIRK